MGKIEYQARQLVKLLKFEIVRIPKSAQPKIPYPAQHFDCTDRVGAIARPIAAPDMATHQENITVSNSSSHVPRPSGCMFKMDESGKAMQHHVQIVSVSQKETS